MSRLEKAYLSKMHVFSSAQCEPPSIQNTSWETCMATQAHAFLKLLITSVSHFQLSTKIGKPKNIKHLTVSRKQASSEHLCVCRDFCKDWPSGSGKKEAQTRKHFKSHAHAQNPKEKNKTFCCANGNAPARLNSCSSGWEQSTSPCLLKIDELKVGLKSDLPTIFAILLQNSSTKPGEPWNKTILLFWCPLLGWFTANMAV